MVPTSCNQLWVSDITYWKISTGEHLYISLITDAYSHKIVGYHVAQTLETVESTYALKWLSLALWWAQRAIFNLHIIQIEEFNIVATIM
ncbi:MAG: hypothetical protein IPO62_08715 [Saprospiraceae bacterium]|nr:hypothetical protein [Saprospiraceae bacterium]